MVGIIPDMNLMGRTRIGQALLFLAHFIFVSSAGGETSSFLLSTFSADVTVPLGHPLMGGGIHPATEIIDPLLAKGVVLFGDKNPIVLASVDWCEIRNDAYDRWREALAEAAGTLPERVLLASIHQHDAPVADLYAQKLLDEQGLENSLCDPDFHESAVRTVARAVRESLQEKRAITHIGLGQAKVEKVASNRRVQTPSGEVSFPRNSATKDPAVRSAPEGLIDPWLKTLSFWDGDKPVAAITAYAVHPMSYYGRGGVTWDFVGMARERRQEEQPSVLQVYFSGCSGDVTAGKYNTGAAENRQALADRMSQAMKSAWEAAEKRPLERLDFKNIEVSLAPRQSEGFDESELEKTIADASKTIFQRNLAALGLSYQKRWKESRPIDVPVVDFGSALFVLMPAETFVWFQLEAQRMRPDKFVVVSGYGECGPGYIPTRQAMRERFMRAQVWSWVGVEAPDLLFSTLEKALK